jgi:hypothetical protein
MISTILIVAISLAVLALLVTAALSPIETLSWWAGWTETEIEQNEVSCVADRPCAHPADCQPKSVYIVYLSGISSLSGRFLIPREKVFVKGLAQHFPDAAVIDDVFPYSPAGVALLASTRLLERVWRFVQRIKLEGRHSVLSLLIHMRNVFQVMISADHRYGPIFNHGAARVIEEALARAGYRQGSGAPVIILGYSGGGQIAVGAAGFLKLHLQAPIDVIAIGGVIASDPGLHVIRRLHYIYADHDNIQKVGAVMFPERWAAMAHSEWNIAKRQGRIVFHKINRMFHAGARGYFGLVKFDGVTNNQRTLKMVVDILSQTPAQPQANGAAPAINQAEPSTVPQP